MKIISLLSGGIDSVTLLYSFINQGNQVEAVTFDYGQRHRKESEFAEYHCQQLGIPLIPIRIRSPFAMFDSSLTDESKEIPLGHYEDESMRQTVVPSRNLIMLSLASAVAISKGFHAVAIGSHAGDHSIYPDCRQEFMEAAEIAIERSNHSKIAVLAPFVRIPKKDILIMGTSIGVPFGMTWTCYQGGETHCGRCGACVERREAFELAGIKDPIIYSP